jgi:Neuraminidase-like domain
MANIAVGSTLVIDTGAAQEAVTATSVSAAGTFTAALAHPHDGSTTPFPIVGQPAPDVGRGWLNLLPGQPDPDPINAPNPDLATASRLGGVLSTLLAFSRIKQALSPGDERLLQLQQAPGALLPNGQPALIGLTGWSAASVNALLKHFFSGLSPDRLADVENFRRVYDAYQIVQTCGVAASTLISALSNAPTATAVNALQSALRAQYAEADWLTVIRPINDAIRIVQRDALVAYILQGFISQQPTELNSIGDTIDSADKLFEFFLIDPMTQPAVETSRLRLALSSVQLFVERILRNLEPNASPGDIDPAKWEWMKRYRVWQANREVFLWPENWLYPQLRDDQSPIFEQTMSALLQGDITDDAATSAYLDYLSNLEQVAKLEPCGLYYAPGAANSGDITYVVARTAGAHRKHYFRQLTAGSWSPWSEVQVDCEDMPLTPIVWKVDGGNRLFLFWLKILKESLLSPKAATKPLHPEALKLPMVDRTVNHKKQDGAMIGDLQAAGPPTSHAASKLRVRAVLCWSEFYNGKWQPTKTSDTNRAADLGTFDPYGSDSFDNYRNLVKITPATCTDHNNPNVAKSNFNWKSLSDALILRLSVPPPDAGSAPAHKPGFVLHNTHSLPTLMEDITASHGSKKLTLGDLLDSPSHWRAFRPAPARYTGRAAAGQFKVNYYSKPETDGLIPPPALSNTVLSFNWAPRFVDAQPGIGGSQAWDAPFIYEDKRNLFFVTTEKRYPAFSLFKGFGLSSPVFRGLDAGAEITPLVVSAAAAAANSGPADPLQIATGQAPGVRFGLNDAAVVSFQTSNIAATGFRVAKL